ncbi:uncharacterized protein BBA_09665 [Beauveria bassiana ARSEF 2860]|uniref:Uncharacterized protein n=1 Tax=Beauveria bassiana (strain ARSEF 2860) TaxID=655819 RepID=J4KL06_BEAB2|nr:uncharacterized protein BBA_09665 [Beauveria bassiana ARSEF 2860]EJP61369.1 hypothetical protein BBA_09665 [Beauveria bassiana ARSEF 2860]
MPELLAVPLARTVYGDEDMQNLRRHYEHVTENCQTAPRCASFHGPHHADHEQCYARPKKVGNTYHKLSKSQKSHARKLRADDYSRQNMEKHDPSLDNLRTQNNKTTTIGNIEEIDIEMADTAEEDDITTPPQEDSLPALGGDDDIRDIEQEQLQSDACAIEEEDIETRRAEENRRGEEDDTDSNEGEDEDADNQDEDENDNNDIIDEREDTRQNDQSEKEVPKNLR